jgi:hypothetical protein
MTTTDIQTPKAATEADISAGVSCAAAAGYACEQCKAPATVECTWHLYEIRGAPRDEPMQNAKLCTSCSDELWSRVKSAVNAVIMHWANTST